MHQRRDEAFDYFQSAFALWGQIVMGKIGFLGRLARASVYNDILTPNTSSLPADEKDMFKTGASGCCWLLAFFRSKRKKAV
jgi:hypothetical protein